MVKSVLINQGPMAGRILTMSDAEGTTAVSGGYGVDVSAGWGVQGQALTGVKGQNVEPVTAAKLWYETATDYDDYENRPLGSYPADTPQPSIGGPFVMPITNISKAANAVITVTGHVAAGLKNGDIVTITGAPNPADIINGRRTVASYNSGAGTFTVGVDTSALTGTSWSGGQASKA